ncbi:uncharacterized protein MYCGRDRAFT_48791, partial [Zymoseptoria tritici IPO323]
MASEQPLRADSYTVAWLCALPIEQAAALLMLDERHQEPDGFHQFLRDDNVYSWGRIAKHNIVIASLPDGEYGLVSAAVTVSGLRASLPHIRIGLMVGIGAGIPWIGDVLLGDVVVSSPDGKSGGVAQYDLYKAKVSSGVATKERKGFLASPPRALRNAIESLKADHEFQDSKLEHFMQVFQRHKKTKVTYGYPGNDKDPLRAELGTEARPHPEIRYGIIASGNRLIKNAQERDEVLEWLSNENIKPICFEMEAASLMNSFPCLVIRGICDYADEHKNDVWQRYAAGTAAAFAKELLGYVRPADVVISPQIGDLVETETVQKTEQTVRDFHASAETQRILDWLCPTDYSKQFTDLSRQHSAGTAEWFLQHPHFQQWALSTNASALFCPGDPGTGKTVISTLAIHHLLHSSGAAGQVAYIFCDYAQHQDQTFEHLMCALLRQVSCTRESCIVPDVEALYRQHEPRKTRPRTSELLSTLETTLKASKNVHLVVDALDECNLPACEDFLTAVKGMPNLALLATSRHVPLIEEIFADDQKIEIRASEEDIRRYVKGRLAEMDKDIQNRDDVMARVVNEVIETADGMFLLARLHMNILTTLSNVRAVKDRLDRLRKGVEAYKDIYEATMSRISSSGQAALAQDALSLLVHAKRQLSPLELQHALAVRQDDEKFDPERMTALSTIISACAGLITIEPQSDVVRLVHYTTREYFQEKLPFWFPNGDMAIAETCVAYLTFPAWPFLNYASRNWALHVEDIERASIDRGTERLILTRVVALLNDPKRLLALCIMEFYHGYDTLLAEKRIALSSLTPWHILAKYDLAKSLQILCALATIELPSNSPGSLPPIIYASRFGSEHAISFFLKLDPTSGDIGEEGERRPLSWAAEFGHVGAVNLLLSIGRADPESRDKTGRTALMYAAWAGHSSVVEALLSTTPATPNSRDARGWTALTYAADRGHFSVVELLLSSTTVSPDMSDIDDRTALSFAAAYGHHSVVELLLSSFSVNTDSRGKDGRTPISWAAGSINREKSHASYTKIVKMLLDTGLANPASVDREGLTPLAWTARTGNLDIVGLLL